MSPYHAADPRPALTVSVPGEEALDRLGELPADVEIVVWDGLTPAPEAASRIALFTGRYDADPPPARVLAGLPALQVVQLVSAGFDAWQPVVPPGVRLCNGRGVHGGSTAELAVGGLLAVLRDLPRCVQAQRDHQWDRFEAPGLDGRRVLVVGAGDIGRRIGAACVQFGADITYVASTARDDVRGVDELPSLLPTAEVVVLAMPLTSRTTGLVDAAFLAALPDGAVLVNISRGRAVDTDALLLELRARRLSAFLDVTDPEPLPPEHPLWTAPNLLLTPHLGGGTVGWQDRAYALVGDQIRRLHAGTELMNTVGDEY